MDKPFGISGLIRCCNEEEFIVPSILSHLPYVDEMVIALQPSTDDTERIVEELAQTFDKIQVYHYPVKPFFVDTKEFHELPDDDIRSFVRLSNWGLERCKYSWISKSEGDVIALSSTQRIVDAIRAKPDYKCYYGRVILNVAGEDCDKISVSNPRNAGWDEAFFPNDYETYHFEKGDKWESMTMPEPRVCMGWSALHMKRCKKKNAIQSGDWVNWNKDNVRDALLKYNANRPYLGIDNDPLGQSDVVYERNWL